MENKFGVASKFLLAIMVILFTFGIVGTTHAAWATCLAGQTTPPTPTDISTDSSPTRIDVKYFAPQNAGGGSLSGYYVTRELSTQTTFGEQPFSSSPISYWKFDGCATGVNDYGSLGSTSNLQPNVSSPNYDVNGKMAGAAKFDGNTWFSSSSSSYNFQNNQQFSISFWMKTISNGQNMKNNNAAVISKSYGYVNGQGWSVWLQSYTDTNPGGYVNFDISDGIHELRVQAWNDHLLDYTNNNFHHVVVTYDGSGLASGMQIYVDGISSAHTIVSNQLGSINYVTPLQIGALPLYNTNVFNGWLDDVRIYNSQLTQIQVNDLFNLNFISSTGPLCPVVSSGTPSCPQRDFPDINAQSIGQKYQVCPVNQYGQGTCLTSLSVALNGLPNTPTNLALSSSALTITWNAPSTATGYYVTRKASSDTTFGEQPFSSSPLSYWKFDGSSTGLKDYGNLANDLQSSVIPLVYDTNGQIGSAVVLDGSSTYFVAPNEFNYDFHTNQPLAISFWMKSPPGLVNDNKDIISKVHGGYLDNQGWNVWLQGYTNTVGAVVFDINDGQNEIKLRSWYNTLFDNTFHHVIVTYDGKGSSSGLTIYIDGNPTTGSPGTNLRDDDFHDTILNNDALTIGALSTYDTNKFTGELDDVRIYNSQLGTSQIADLNGYTSIVTSPSFTDNSNPQPTNPAYKVYAVNQYGQGFASSTASTVSTRSIAIDQSSYLINHAALITVTDPDANLKESVRDVIYVSAIDTNTGSAIKIPLTETGPNTNTFDNSGNLLVLSSSTASSIPALGVNPGDSITVTYLEKTATFTIMNTPAAYVSIGMPTQSFTKITCGASPDNDPGGSSAGDGICDWWEDPSHNGGLSGLFIPTADYGSYHLSCGPGQLDPTCPDPSMKDVYVQVDWMAGHTPSQSAINAVVNAFAAHNIRLHVILGEQLPFHYDTIYWSQDMINGNFVPSFQDIKQQYFLLPSERACPENLTPVQCTTYQQEMYNAKSQVFHYALFVHNLDVTGQSGEGEIYGNDFAVSLGGFVNEVGSPDDQAATFMHELGHNLNLNHGGSTLISDSATNCKPNYLSIMSYARQFSSFIFDRPIDFSDDALGNLNEISGISESAGIGDQHVSGQKTVYGGLSLSTGQPFNPPTVIARTNNSPLDYNRDGSTSTTAPNQNIHWINIPGCQDSTARNLQGADDWDNLGYSFTSSVSVITGAPIDSSTPATNDELTSDSVNKMHKITITSLQGEIGNLP